MSGHNIIAFVGPGVALCDRCNQELDVYEWSEPCEADTIETPVPGEDDGRNAEMPMVAAAVLLFPAEPVRQRGRRSPEPWNRRPR